MKMSQDEIAAMMQTGLSRVQATKALYEIAKQKKRDEVSNLGSKYKPSVTPTAKGNQVKICNFSTIASFSFSHMRSQTSTTGREGRFDGETAS